MRLIPLLRELLIDALFGNDTLALWEEDVINLITFAFATILLCLTIKWILELVFGFFKRL